MKCDELEKFDAVSNADLSAGYDHRYAYEADEVDEAIAELKARNVMFHDEAKYYKAENRRLQRALWLARAERAKEMAKGYNAVVEWCSHSRWIEVERKCLKKAKEYK